ILHGVELVPVRGCELIDTCNDTHRVCQEVQVCLGPTAPVVLTRRKMRKKLAQEAPAGYEDNRNEEDSDNHLLQHGAPNRVASSVPVSVSRSAATPRS